MNALVSVIIPTYNRKESLLRSVESVLNQTYKNIEIIIVDDNSSDGTSEKVQEISDNRVDYIKLERNSGACAARNTGIRNAHGDYIAFQDSDDYWYPEKLEKQFAFLSSYDADVSFCRFRRINTAGEEIALFPHEETAQGILTYKDLLFENLASTQCIIAKKSVMNRELFDERYPRFQDWELILRLSGKYRTAYQKEVLVDVLVQDKSISGNPHNAVLAQRMLFKRYRREILENPRIIYQWMFSFEYFSSFSGDNIIPDYLKMLSVKNNKKINKEIVKRIKDAIISSGR